MDHCFTCKLYTIPASTSRL